MILAEPSPSQGDLHFSLLGFPGADPSLFLADGAVAGVSLRRSGSSSPCGLWPCCCAFSCTSWGTRWSCGPMDFDPSIVLYSFGGLAIPHPGRYGVRRPGPWGDMLIAFAGPASGFILAAVLVLGLHYLGGYPVSIFDPSWRDVVPVVLVPNATCPSSCISFFISPCVGPAESLADLSAGRRPNRPADLRPDQSAGCDTPVVDPFGDRRRDDGCVFRHAV